jgi:hypothetical protein
MDSISDGSVTSIKVRRQHVKKQFPYPLYVKYINLNGHVQVFKTIIWVDGEMEDENIVNMFIITLHNIISLWS